MTLLADLAVQLRRYDDDAWSALASKGLLRRAGKDLVAGPPSLVAATDTEVTVAVGDHAVGFDARGAAQASCTCPAAGVCQHIVTAGLWLAVQDVAADQHAGPEQAPPDPHTELMALAEAELVAHAGRAGYRWALQFVADQDPESVQVETGAQVLVGFAQPRVTFRYMGGDVGSLVADAGLPAIEKHRVAAILAYQRAFGATVTPLPPAAAATPRAELVEARVRFRVALARLLTDTVRLGVSHLSPAVRQRFETMAVWAQGVEYHRLALILRRLADQIELLLTRSARADEHLLLDQSAIAFALVTALDRAPDERRLVGLARNRYDDVRSMTVVGLGGLPWRSGTGYHGLTCLFWWLEESRFVSWTDARPQSLGGFDPRSRCTQPGPWTGLRSPAESFGQAVRLTGARLSAVGRLSGVERTHASVAAAGPDELPPVIEEWSELEARGRASLLDLPDPLNDWVLLRPAGFGRAAYNPVRQVVEWPVVDSHGAVLTLRLRWTSVNAHAVNRLETLGPADLADGTVVVARLFRDAGTTLAEPLSLIRPGGVVDVIHFDGQAPAAAATNLPESPGDEPALDTDELPDPSHSALPDALRELRSWLVSQAERGTAAASAGGVLAELDSRHRALREAGLSPFAELGAADGRLDPAEAMLRTHYLYLQTAAVLTWR